MSGLFQCSHRQNGGDRREENKVNGTRTHPAVLLCTLGAPFHVFQPFGLEEGARSGQQELGSHKK